MADPAGTASRPAWLFDEIANAGRENLDGHHAATYDLKQDAGAAAEVELLSGLGLGSRSRVVDLGAGTGQFVIAVAPVCARVVAVDVSDVMLDRLRRKVHEAGIANVDVVRAGFLTYEHAGPPVDVVYTRWALHQLPDFWKTIALQRMRSMLRPGGLLRLSDIVFSFDPAEAAERVERWCARYPAEGSGEEWTRADVEEHVRDEHSTFTWLLEPMIGRAGFVIDRVAYSDDGVLAAYVARAI